MKNVLEKIEPYVTLTFHLLDENQSQTGVPWDHQTDMLPVLLLLYGRSTLYGHAGLTTVPSDSYDPAVMIRSHTDW